MSENNRDSVIDAIIATIKDMDTAKLMIVLAFAVNL